MEDDFDQIVQLHKANKWQEILQLNHNQFDFRKLLWVWPSEQNLQFLKHALTDLRIEGVISIGCGSGLFEWLFMEASGFPVVGLEVNEEWWRSRYSPPKFIQLTFPPQPPKSDLLRRNFALLFCYFNDGVAFREYVKSYKGDVVVIIGPGSGTARHTDPDPFHPDFGNPNWELHQIQEVKNSGDFIAIFKKITK